MDWQPFLPVLQNARLEIAAFGLDRKDHFAEYSRTIPYYAVSYMSSGRSYVQFADERVEYGPGDAFLISPGTQHDHVQLPGEPAEFLWWNFSYQVASCVDALQAFELPRKVHMRSDERFCAVFRDYLISAEQPQSPTDVLMGQARALEMVALILGEAFASGRCRLRRGAPGQMGAVLADIHTRIASHNLLRELSERHNLHPTYLSNRFTNVFGLSPTVLQRRLRLQRARDLLRDSRESIGAIAATLGYESANNFTRFFTQAEGCTPSDYRKAFNRSHL